MPSPVKRNGSRPQQVGPRRDPVLKQSDGTPRGYQLVRKDPNRVYVWANRGDRQCGEWKYRGLGYRVETYQPDGVSVRGGGMGETGHAIENGSLVLMSIDKVTWEDIVASGDGENEGMAWADRMEHALIAPSGMKDTVRGQHGQVYLREKKITEEPGGASPVGEVIMDEEI